MGYDYKLGFFGKLAKGLAESIYICLIQHHVCRRMWTTILKELYLEAFSVANIVQKLADKFNFKYQRQHDPGREVLVYMKNLKSFSYTHVA